MSKNALILGISGQDGAYLSKFLLSKDYNILGTTRSLIGHNFENLENLNIQKQVQIIEVDPLKLNDVISAIEKSVPDEIYFLSGQSSVSASLRLPLQAMGSNLFGISNVLEACRITQSSARIYNAGSSECFGNTAIAGANETTKIDPKSPYGAAKAASLLITKVYREAFDMYACTGILFNHESSLRPDHFVSKKIISAALRIARGSREKLCLGNVGIIRDWGWAPEYVEAMWLMLQQNIADDYVIGTGVPYSLENFAKEAFSLVGLNWKDFVEIDRRLLRTNEISVSVSNPDKALKELKWRARVVMPQLLERLINEC